MQIPERRCKDCGFLSQRLMLGGIPHGFIGVEEDARRTGKFPTRSEVVILDENPSTPVPNAQPAPICFVRAIDLGLDSQNAPGDIKAYRIAVGDQNTEITQDEINRHVINCGRRCASFVQWNPGLTPKEHLKMVNLQEERQWREDRLREDKEWRDKVDKRDAWYRRIELVILALTLIAVILVSQFQNSPTIIVQPSGAFMQSTPDTQDVQPEATP